MPSQSIPSKPENHNQDLEILSSLPPFKNIYPRKVTSVKDVHPKKYEELLQKVKELDRRMSKIEQTLRIIKKRNLNETNI